MVVPPECVVVNRGKEPPNCVRRICHKNSKMSAFVLNWLQVITAVKPEECHDPESRAECRGCGRPAVGAAVVVAGAHTAHAGRAQRRLPAASVRAGAHWPAATRAHGGAATDAVCAR